MQRRETLSYFQKFWGGLPLFEEVKGTTNEEKEVKKLLEINVHL